MNTNNYSGVWIFGDHRNYYQDRVTLQLIAKGKDLAEKLGTETYAVIFGYQVDEYVKEYIAHGADIVYQIDDSLLENYQIERYTTLMCDMINKYKPEILLIGATSFGREFAPVVAKRLNTGLSADCIALDIDPQSKLLIQTSPAFGGEILALITTPNSRPQMATVRPGIFKETPHNYEREGEVIKCLINSENIDIKKHIQESKAAPRPTEAPKDVEPLLKEPEIRYEKIATKINPEDDKIKLLNVTKQHHKSVRLENANIVVCGGRGVGNKEKFNTLKEIAEMLNAEVGATRPVVDVEWISHEHLVGQAGKSIKPKLLLSLGISGAIQHLAAIRNSEYIIAVNRDPKAQIFKIADLGAIGDINQVLLQLKKALFDYSPNF